MDLKDFKVAARYPIDSNGNEVDLKAENERLRLVATYLRTTLNDCLRKCKNDDTNWIVSHAINETVNDAIEFNLYKSIKDDMRLEDRL